MAENPSDNKEIRHQKAKGRHQNYQRVLSCKNLLTKQTPYFPSPGQFIVQNSHLPKIHHTKSTITLTKDIKKILKDRNASPINEILHEVSSRKAEKKNIPRSAIPRNDSESKKNKSSSCFRRPISAKIYEETEGKSLEQSRILREVIEKGRNEAEDSLRINKNRFQVRNRVSIPKHIQGYHMVKLNDNQRSLTLKSEYLEHEKEIIIEPSNKNKMTSVSENRQPHYNQKNQKCQGEQNDPEERWFLPTEYYLINQESPNQLLNKYKNEEGEVYGFSKWFHTDGTSSWRRCLVLGYSMQNQRWDIEWLGSGVRKKVSRNNLYFENEDFQAFQKMADKAQQFKRKSETFMKYNILIDLMESSVPLLPQDSFSRIKKLTGITGVNKNPENPTIIKLTDEVTKLFKRSCHKFQFNMTLPFSDKYKKMFSSVLPAEYFQPDPFKVTQLDHKKITNLSNKRSKEQFEKNQKLFKEKSYLNSQKKIKIFEILNLMTEELQRMSLFKDYSRVEEKQYTPTEIEALLSRNINEYFYKTNCRICDIEHYVSKELDPVYANKKMMQQENYKTIMAKYRSFLLLINLRLEDLLRHATAKFISGIHEHIRFETANEELSVEDVMEDKGQQIIVVKMSAQIKDGKLDVSPNFKNLEQIIKKTIDKIVAQVSKMKCISKTYIDDICPNNLLRIIRDQKDQSYPNPIRTSIAKVQQNLHIIGRGFDTYIQELKSTTLIIFKLNDEIQKKFQKKNAYNQIQDIIEEINQYQHKLQTLTLLPQVKICQLFLINVEEVRKKLLCKISQTMKEVVRNVLDRISKDNQKMQKNIQTIVEGMSKVPKNIHQYVELENYVHDFVFSQIKKAEQKAKNLTQKLNLLDKTRQVIDYKDFEVSCQIYLKPLKLSKARQDAIYKLQNIYKRNFGDELVRDSYLILDNIKICEKLFEEVKKNKTLKEMDQNYKLFSKLHTQLDGSYQKMLHINEKECLLKWAKTDFEKLLDIKQEFDPFYKLITLHKNYQLNVLLLYDEPFSNLNYQSLSTNIYDSIETLKNLLDANFKDNDIYEPIVQKILASYEDFDQNLTLIKNLRNPDLRDRHWVIIERITGVSDIRGQKITLRIILSEKVKKHSEQLIKISTIASKELGYQKILNTLKRGWKDVRVVIGYQKTGDTSLKVIQNIEDINQKLEQGIIQINSILSSEFIKFLEEDILNWKSLILDKIYDFAQYWTAFEKSVIQHFSIISQPFFQQSLPEWEQRKKTLQKCWGTLLGSIEFQSFLIQIIQNRTWENIAYIEEQIKQNIKIMEQYFQERKKTNPKLRAFTNEELIQMSGQKDSEQAKIKKIQRCFPGILHFSTSYDSCNKYLIATTHSGQSIKIKLSGPQKEGMHCQDLNQQNINKKDIFCETSVDKLINEVDKQLKKCLKKEFQGNQSQNQQTFAQINILKRRIKFVQKIEQTFQQKQVLDKIEMEIKLEKLSVISYLYQRRGTQSRAINCEILELINEQRILNNLNSQQVTDADNYEWKKLPRHYLVQQSMSLNNEKVLLEVGNFQREYSFQFVDCRNFIHTPDSDRVFLNLTQGISDKAFVILTGQSGSGRGAYLQYLSDLLGKSCMKIACNSAINESTWLLEQYIKMAAGGLMMVLEELQTLSISSINILKDKMELLWMNYRFSFQMQSKVPTTMSIKSTANPKADIFFNVHQFNLFGIYNTLGNQPPTINLNRQMFRSLSIPPTNLTHLIPTILSSRGISVDDTISFQFITDIFQELRYHNLIENNFSKINVNNFLWNFVENLTIQYRKNRNLSENIENKGKIQMNLIEKALSQVVIEVIGENQQIWEQILSLNLINEQIVKKEIEVRKSRIAEICSPSPKQNSLSIEKHHQNQKRCSILQKIPQKMDIINQLQPLKRPTSNNLSAEISSEIRWNSMQASHIFEFEDDRQKYVSQFNNKYRQLVDKLNKKRGVLVIGPSVCGKTTLIKALNNSKQYILESLNPGAYKLQDLYYSNKKNGIIVELLEKFSKIKEKNKKIIHFDHQIGAWSDPLHCLLDNPIEAIFPSASIMMSIPESHKIVIESPSLENIVPNQISCFGIITLKHKIIWKSCFKELIFKYFKEDFIESENYGFLVKLCRDTIDSILQFYASVTKSDNNFSNSNNQGYLVLESCTILENVIKNLSTSLYDPTNQAHLNDLLLKQRNVNRKAKSDIKKIEKEIEKSQLFSHFTSAVILTVGYLIPGQSRKTFSRHLKYVLEQTDLCRYGWKNNSVIARDQEHIYNYYYEGGQWKKWETAKFLGDGIAIHLNDYKIVQQILMKYIDRQEPVLLIGPPSTSKNYIFKNLLSFLPPQKFKLSKHVLSKLTDKSNVFSCLLNLVKSDRYNTTMKKISNCKQNLFYIDDLSMPLQKRRTCENSLLQFMRQFYNYGGWFIENTFRQFRNVQFLGTLNTNKAIPQRLVRFLNPLMISCSEDRIQTILKVHVNNQIDDTRSIQNQMALVMRCTLNLHQVVKREFMSSQCAVWNPFGLSDMIKVISGVSSIMNTYQDKVGALQKLPQSAARVSLLTRGKHTTNYHPVLRLWVYLSEMVYGSKIKEKQKDSLFYLINNVLMEEERVRYKTIHPTSNFFIASLNPTKKYCSYTLETFSESLVQLLQNQKEILQQFYQQNKVEFLKLLVRILNLFDFSANVMVLVNYQIRRVSPLIRFASKIQNSGFCQASINLAGGFQKEKAQTFCQKINNQLTGICEKSLSQSSNTTPSLANANISSSSHSLNNKKQEICSILLLNDKKDVKNAETANKILEDILSYQKFRQLPQWAIPQIDNIDWEASQISQQMVRLDSDKKQVSKKPSMKTLRKINMGTKHNISAFSSRQQSVAMMTRSAIHKFRIVLHYYTFPKYLLENYPTLLDQAGIHFLNNQIIHPAQTQISNSVSQTNIMMTDFDRKSQDVHEFYNFYNPFLSETQRKHSKIVDYVYEVITKQNIFSSYQKVINEEKKQPFRQNKKGKRASGKIKFCKVGLEKLQDHSLGDNGKEVKLSHKQSFRILFSRFYGEIQQKNDEKDEIQRKIEKNMNNLAQIISKLQENNKNLKQCKLHQQRNINELAKKIEEQKQFYLLQKKKKEDLVSNLEKKENILEQAESKYRHTMRNYEQKFSHARNQLLNLIQKCQIQIHSNTNKSSKKLNKIQQLPTLLQGNENRPFIQAISYLLSIITLDPKKKDEKDIAYQVVLKEFMTVLEQKKVEKRLCKMKVEQIGSKVDSKVRKILQIVMQNDKKEAVNRKISLSKPLSKKMIEEKSEQMHKQENIMKNSELGAKQIFYEFFMTFMDYYDQFKTTQNKQCYDLIQNTIKMREKLKLNLQKMNKNKTTIDMLNNYEKMMEQKLYLQSGLIELSNKEKSHTRILQSLQFQFNQLKDIIASQANNMKVEKEEKCSNKQACFVEALSQTIYMRFVNEIIKTPFAQTKKLFQQINRHLQKARQQLECEESTSGQKNYLNQVEIYIPQQITNMENHVKQERNHHYLDLQKNVLNFISKNSICFVEVHQRQLTQLSNEIMDEQAQEFGPAEKQTMLKILENDHSTLTSFVFDVAINIANSVAIVSTIQFRNYLVKNSLSKSYNQIIFVLGRDSEQIEECLCSKWEGRKVVFLVNNINHCFYNAYPTLKIEILERSLGFVVQKCGEQINKYFGNSICPENTSVSYSSKNNQISTIQPLIKFQNLQIPNIQMSEVEYEAERLEKQLGKIVKNPAKIGKIIQSENQLVQKSEQFIQQIENEKISGLKNGKNDNFIEKLAILFSKMFVYMDEQSNQWMSVRNYGIMMRKILTKVHRHLKKPLHSLKQEGQKFDIAVRKFLRVQLNSYLKNHIQIDLGIATLGAGSTMQDYLMFSKAMKFCRNQAKKVCQHKQTDILQLFTCCVEKLKNYLSILPDKENYGLCWEILSNCSLILESPTQYLQSLLKLITKGIYSNQLVQVSRISLLCFAVLVMELQYEGPNGDNINFKYLPNILQTIDFTCLSRKEQKSINLLTQITLPSIIENTCEAKNQPNQLSHRKIMANLFLLLSEQYYDIQIFTCVRKNKKYGVQLLFICQNQSFNPYEPDKTGVPSELAIQLVKSQKTIVFIVQGEQIPQSFARTIKNINEAHKKISNEAVTGEYKIVVVTKPQVVSKQENLFCKFTRITTQSIMHKLSIKTHTIFHNFYDTFIRNELPSGKKGAAPTNYKQIKDFNSLEPQTKYELVCFIHTFKQCMQIININGRQRSNMVAIEQLMIKFQEFLGTFVSNKKQQILDCAKKWGKILKLMLCSVFSLDGEKQVQKHIRQFGQRFGIEMKKLGEGEMIDEQIKTFCISKVKQQEEKLKQLINEDERAEQNYVGDRNEQQYRMILSSLGIHKNIEEQMCLSDLLYLSRRKKSQNGTPLQNIQAYCVIDDDIQQFHNTLTLNSSQNLFAKKEGKKYHLSIQTLTNRISQSNQSKMKDHEQKIAQQRGSYKIYENMTSLTYNAIAKQKICKSGVLLLK